MNFSFLNKLTTTSELVKNPTVDHKFIRDTETSEIAVEQENHLYHRAFGMRKIDIAENTQPTERFR